MPRPGRRTASLALTALIVLALVTPATAATATDRIRGFFASVNRLIADPTYGDRTSERLAALHGLVVEIVNFRTAAAVALGAEWKARTPAEREEFARLFADLLQTSMFSSVGARARLDNGLTVTYVGELRDSDGVTVATSVLTRSGGEMAVGYRMAVRDGRWMVHDVVVDGVSLVDNYRAQFQKVIARSSYAGLVSEMRARLADLGRPATAEAAPPSAPITVVAAAPTGVVTAIPREEPAAPALAPLVVAAPAPVVSTVVGREAVPAEPVAERRSLEVSRPAPAPVAAAIVAPRTMAPPATSGTAYWVQVGAFREVKKAMQVVAALRDQAVSLVTTPDHPLMRVLLGPFTDRNVAARKLREIRARGYEGFIAEAPK